MFLQLGDGVAPTEKEIHYHVVNVFIKCFVYIAVKVLLTDKLEDLSLMPPILQFLLFVIIVRLISFYFDQIQAVLDYIKQYQNNWESVLDTICGVLAHFHQVIHKDVRGFANILIYLKTCVAICLFAKTLCFIIIYSLDFFEKVLGAYETQHSRVFYIFIWIFTIGKSDSFSNILLKNVIILILLTLDLTIFMTVILCVLLEI